MSSAHSELVITSYANAPVRAVTGGTTYAYRELGPQGGIPVIFFVHLAATLDNWDPRIVDPIAKRRHVIAFDNKGVGAPSGMIAQDLVLKHPDLVRKLVLTGTGPRGGKDMDKVVRTTYWDIPRATLTGADPKEFLFVPRRRTCRRSLCRH